MASSRTWVWMNRVASAVRFVMRATAVAGVTATRYPTPATSMITSPSPERMMTLPRRSPITAVPLSCWAPSGAASLCFGSCRLCPTGQGGPHGTPQRNGRQVAHGEGQGIGGIRRVGGHGESKHVGHHALHLVLRGGPVTDQR